MRITFRLLPLLLLYISPSQARPRCQHPIPKYLPEVSDCQHILDDIRKQARDTGNPLFTASRGHSSNMELPNLYWDHIPKSTCAVYIDLIESKFDSTDVLRLGDVLEAMLAIADECKLPDSNRQLNEGWDVTGRHKYINISIERLHWDTKTLGTAANFTIATRGRDNHTAVQ